MEAKGVHITGSFTFIWVIENCPTLLTPKGIESPVFEVDSLENTKWSLRIRDCKEDNLFYSIRRGNDTGPATIEAVFELQLHFKTELRATSEYRLIIFDKGGFMKFETPLAVIFRSEGTQHLENDALTLRCRMWKVGIQRLEPSLCCARARQALERKTVLWIVERFNALLPEHCANYRVESEEGTPLITLALGVRDVHGYESVWIKILGTGESKFHRLNCEFSVLDISGKKHFTFKFKHLSTKKELSIPFFDKVKLMNQETNLLPGDVLTVRCELEIGSGTVVNEIEHYSSSTSPNNAVVI
ncbi:speckle-type POZ protein [Trichonephila clavata]|uniref:Speckle-type POZ protein n=1 Tax=Trichonephila clavata TaxID=2740835 RepID=A0A8X6LQP0_TRICU|nr:speckle-type POZ protein [Trichonephila clavata]